MPKILSIFFLVFCATLTSEAQFSQYLITLKDKKGSPYSVSRPQDFLSERAIRRRTVQNIPIGENDLPVNPQYIDSIRAAGNVIIKNTSKWLNQVCIETTDEVALQKIASFPFVSGHSPVRRLAADTTLFRKFDEPRPVNEYLRGAKGETLLEYGVAAEQIKIHNGHRLHDKGFTGRGILISVIDDGFYHYRSLPAFDSVRLQNRILETYDFVDQKTDMNEEDAHGMYCFSLIAANVPGQMIGTAPGASFLLYRSENIYGEYPGEEQNWLAAVERSDSAGADIITTSLGYSSFDNPQFNYTYSDMNGRTTLMARGARIAASKGMILTVAAGNDGNKAWHFVSTPGDAMDVLTVGAVNSEGSPAPFSSYGPTADGRVKPDVAAVGWGAYVQAAHGVFVSGNGTSFATPIMAGLVGCLWQAFPEFNSFEIMDAVRKSSHQFSQPDDRVGYGIPDFEKAYETLAALRLQRRQDAIIGDNNLMVFPNPAKESATLLLRAAASGQATIRCYDQGGKFMFMQTLPVKAGITESVSITRGSLPTGLYVLRIEIGGKLYSAKVIFE